MIGAHKQRRFLVDIPDEAMEELRRRIAATNCALIDDIEVDKGGQFTAWEQPQLFSGEIRVAFRSLR